MQVGSPLRRSAFSDHWQKAVAAARRLYVLQDVELAWRTTARVFLDAEPGTGVTAVARALEVSRDTAKALVLEARAAGLLPTEGADHLARAKARTAIGNDPMPARVVFHDLRHFYSSLLIRHAESVKTVQARLGHASATEMLDTYSHLWPDSDDPTRKTVDLVMGAPVSASDGQMTDSGALAGAFAQVGS
ncbi:tyrosine-type recombinase/integrase [Xylanimonas sp. McL0601]|uniref:tyrosine-type recombinase/integrase n=1 Tax=Xylanimonas sp. McL0601 TaxID=3414739 RepID=UPI003CE9E153